MQFTVSYILPVIIYYLDLRIIIDLLTEETEYQHCIYGDDDNVLFLYVEITIFRKSGHYGQYLSWVAIYMHFQRFVDIIIKVCLFGGVFFWSNDQFAI